MNVYLRLGDHSYPSDCTLVIVVIVVVVVVVVDVVVVAAAAAAAAAAFGCSFKVNSLFIKTYFRITIYQCIKHFESRSGPTFCRSCSG